MTDLNTDKNVYILGAGFSKELGLPLQDEFILISKEVFFRDTNRYKHFEKVFKYQDGLTKMRKYLNYPLWNLEQLFNLVEMDCFYSEEKDVLEIKSDFIKLINDTLTELTPNPFSNDESGKLICDKTYKNYLHFLNTFIDRDKHNSAAIHLHKDTIISFNYDLVFETVVSIYNWGKEKVVMDKALPNNNNYFIKLNTIFGKDNIKNGSIHNFFIEKRGGSYFPEGDIFSDSEQSLKLIKLHGSINWTSVADGKKFIVPPTWNKSDTEIRKLWDMAYKELKEARRIIIIGYSFPEIDIYVKSLLALALNENKILQNVYFINPNKDVVRDSCLSLLDKHFEKYCAYKEWTFSNYISSDDGKKFIRDELHRPA